jgi:hypothetical protein
LLYFQLCPKIFEKEVFMMDFKKVVEERRSIRKFKSDTIPVEDIMGDN